jgi:alanyl-tRNA synthetase
LQKQAETYMHEKVAMMKSELLKQAKPLGAYKLVEIRMPMPAHVVKELAFQLRNAEPNVVVAVAAINDGKPMITLMLADELVKKGLNASNIVREAAKQMDGSGGGQPFYATAGGKNPDGLNAAFDKMLAMVKELSI